MEDIEDIMRKVDERERAKSEGTFDIRNHFDVESERAEELRNELGDRVAEGISVEGNVENVLKWIRENYEDEEEKIVLFWFATLVGQNQYHIEQQKRKEALLQALMGFG